MTKIWQVEWASAPTGASAKTALPPQYLRQFFPDGEAAVAFKKKLVQAAALLGTGVSPVVSEIEVNT